MNTPMTLPIAPAAIVQPVASLQPAVNAARAAKITLMKQAIASLKLALAGYESELARLEALP